MSRAAAISLEDVDPVELSGGSWSRLLVTDQTVSGNTSSLGYSVFAAGTATADLSHAVEELAYVVSGRGAIRLEDDAARGARRAGPVHPGPDVAHGSQPL